MKLQYLTILTFTLFTSCTQSSDEEKNPKTIAPQNYFTNISNKHAFTKEFSHLTNEEIDIWYLGRSFFKVPWITAPSITTMRDGLGPLFSANTCINCHPNNGAGVAVKQNGEMTRSYLLRLSLKDSNDSELLKRNGFEPDPTYGAQFSRNGSANVPSEGQALVHYEKIEGQYPDGTNYVLRKPSYELRNLGYGALDKNTVIAGRIGSALIGLGLLENISEKDILQYEDINDKNNDGISGKANYAFNPETNQTQLGRFTWKASATTVKHQSAGAAHNDMGLSNPLFPTHNCSEKQIKCIEQANLAEHAMDLPAFRLDALSFYVSNLAVPKQRKPKKHLDGAKLFKSLNCTACHVPEHTTSTGVKIKPYTDLLVHDMGKGLADERSEFLATGNEWRTAPLWGMGLYKKVSGEANYLHDGRAKSIEEAILWHGGEAQKSKEDFMALEKQSRNKVLEFLNSI